MSVKLGICNSNPQGVKIMLIKEKVSLAVLAFLVGVTSNAAWAQTLEEITVTAQKREESLAEVPISIAVFSGQEIQNRSIDSMSVLSQSMPNVFIDENQIEIGRAHV